MTSKPDHDSGDKPILIYTTFPALAAAEAAASKLLDGSLITCANIAIDPIAGSADYFAWIAAQTAGVTGTA